MSQNFPQGAQRKLVHTREIVCEGYARADGLYDIEALMCDTKGQHSRLLFKALPPGEALHDMRFTITVDTGLTIRAAHARTEAAPTPWCAQINAAYEKLVGVTIGNGFMKQVKSRLGGAQGCTHLTELLGPMATVAFQTVMNLNGGALAHVDDPAVQSMLDTCHAWRTDGEVVRVLRERPASPTGNHAKTSAKTNADSDA